MHYRKQQGDFCKDEIIYNLSSAGGTWHFSKGDLKTWWHSRLIEMWMRSNLNTCTLAAWCQTISKSFTNSQWISFSDFDWFPTSPWLKVSWTLQYSAWLDINAVILVFICRDGPTLWPSAEVSYLYLPTWYPGIQFQWRHSLEYKLQIQEACCLDCDGQHYA